MPDAKIPTSQELMSILFKANILLLFILNFLNSVIEGIIFSKVKKKDMKSKINIEEFKKSNTSLVLLKAVFYLYLYMAYVYFDSVSGNTVVTKGLNAVVLLLTFFAFVELEKRIELLVELKKNKKILK